MAVTAADFTTGGRFPEFFGAPAASVAACIAEAEARTPEDVWGSLRDQGVLYLAAHLLAMSPNAVDMRLKNDPTDSIYNVQRRKLARAVASGFRVVGTTDGIVPDGR